MVWCGVVWDPSALCGRGQGYINKVLNGHCNRFASRDRIDGIKLIPYVHYSVPVPTSILCIGYVHPRAAGEPHWAHTPI